MARNPIKNIIFDWSGVLSDDVQPVWKAYNCLFKCYGKATMSLDEFRNSFVLPYTIFWERYFPEIPGKELLDKFNYFFKQADSGPKPFENANRVLSELKSRDISMIVLSAHSFAEEEAEKYFPGKDYFKKVFSEIVDKQKALPEILKKINFFPTETAYVGDMVADIEAGKSCNLTTIAILTGYQSRKVLEAANPDFVISDLNKLFDII